MSAPQHDSLQIDVSSWWGMATISLVVCGGTVLIAQSLGPGVVQTLIYSSLIAVFAAGGVMIGYLAMQALGAGQRWDLGNVEDAEEQRSPSPNSSSSSFVLRGLEEPVTDETNTAPDPFTEILKRNSIDRRAA